MDQARLDHLYKTYGPAIFSRCRRMLGDDHRAEDAAHETFLRIARHLDKAPDSREALTWIYRIATNYCLNVLRGQRRWEASLDRLTAQAGLSDPEQHYLDADFVSRLIDHLPVRLRVTAWLHYVDGLQQDEVARLLGVSRRTVVSRLAQFLASAREFAARSER